MDLDRELLTSRIISGITVCKVNLCGIPHTFLLKRPSRLDRYLSNEVYEEALYTSSFDLISKEQTEQHLIVMGFWTLENNGRMEKLKKDIDDIKVGLFKAHLDSKKTRDFRKILSNTKLAFRKLEETKHSLDHITPEGYAMMVKTQYLISSSLFHMNGTKVWPTQEFLEGDYGILDKVLQFINQNNISVDSLRVLARTEPWRSYWQANKENIFTEATVDWTEEQKTLVLFSNMYDNAYGHPECPSDTIIEDDDMFDGWMIEQRRKSEKEKNTKTVENTFQNLKGDDVFIPAKSKEDAGKIDELNTFEGKMSKTERMAMIKKQGKVKDIEFPDRKREITKMYNEQIKARGKK